MPLVNVTDAPVELLSVDVVGDVPGSWDVELTLDDRGGDASSPSLGLYVGHPPQMLRGQECVTARLLPIGGYVVLPGVDQAPVVYVRAVADRPGALDIDGVDVVYRRGLRRYAQRLLIGLEVFSDEVEPYHPADFEQGC